MASVKVLLRKENKDNDYGYIKVRVIENRKAQFKSLGIKVRVKDWNENLQRVRKSHPEHELINNTIEQKLNELREYHYNIYAINENTQSIFRFYEQVIETTSVRGTRDKYKAIRNLFRKFVESLEKKDFLFHELTSQRVKEFYKWMRENGISQDTANYNLKSFKAIINKARTANVYIYVHDPFADIKLKFTRKQNKGLSELELKKLIVTDFEDKRDFNYSRRGGQNIPLSEIRQVFLFQLFAQGMRVSDTLLLRWSNFRVTEKGIFVDYVMRKTKKEISVFLNEVAIQLLRHRLIKYFPNLNTIIQEQTDAIEEIGESLKDIDTILENYKEFDAPIHNVKDVQLKYARIYQKYSSDSVPKEQLKKHNRDRVSLEIKVVQALEMKQKLEKLQSQGIQNLRGLYEEAIIRLSTNEKYSYQFVFHFLKNEDFLDIKLNDFSMLNDTQYLRLCGQRSYYNVLLKELQKQAEIQTRLTSHVARHTYTQLLLDDGSADLADISKSLGHTHLSTTQAYIARFPSERVSRLSTNLSDKFKKLF